MMMHSFVHQKGRDGQQVPDDCLIGPSYLSSDPWSLDLALHARAEYVPARTSFALAAQDVEATTKNGVNTAGSNSLALSTAAQGRNTYLSTLRLRI